MSQTRLLLTLFIVLAAAPVAAQAQETKRPPVRPTAAPAQARPANATARCNDSFYWTNPAR